MCAPKPVDISRLRKGVTMKLYNKITPEGTRDLLFEECAARRLAESRLKQVFVSHGYQEAVTPGIEFYDVFEPARSGIPQEIMMKMSDQKGRLMVLRPDTTTPIARLAATRLQNMERPMRFYYNQPIYRSNPGLTGRSNETVESGVELLGVGGKRADVEAIAMAAEAMESCLPGFRMEIGHAGFFRALAAELPISEEEREEIRSTIESKNYAALNTILEKLPDSPAVRAMAKLPRLFGGKEVFEEAFALCSSPEAVETLRYLQELYESLSGLGLGSRMMVDLGLVQRNDYYTGVVFSAYVEEWGDAVLLGGRYDNLLARFDSPMPAVGFSVIVDAVAQAMMKRGQGAEVKKLDVLIFAEEGMELAGIQYARRLSNEEGLICENALCDTLEEAKVLAGKKGIARVDLVGKTEIVKGGECQ